MRHLRVSDEIVLDVGCGEGLTLEKLVRDNPEKVVLGIELLRENIDILKSHGLPVQQASVHHLPFPNESIDFILFSEVLEHISQPEGAMREIHRVLKIGGRVSIIVPNDLVFKIARLLTGRFKEARFDPGHKRQWTPSMLSHFIGMEGFRPVYSRNIPFFFWPLSLHAVVVGEKV